jgi:hypothetical protein
MLSTVKKPMASQWLLPVISKTDDFMTFNALVLFQGVFA